MTLLLPWKCSKELFELYSAPFKRVNIPYKDPNEILSVETQVGLRKKQVDFDISTN